MGAERARRWKLLPFRSLSLPPAAAASKAKNRPPDVPVPPSPVRKEAQEEVPAEFLCPILGAPMTDPVILPSGRTYERACVRACAELGLSLAPDGVVAAEGSTPGGGVAVAIPNDALRAAVRTWCARTGRAAPVAPPAEEAREAVLRAVPAARAPAKSASNLSCSSEGASAASTSSSSTSGRSSREMAAADVEGVRGGKAAPKEKEKEKEEEPARVADAEEEAVAKAVEAGDEREVEAAMAALRRATREGAERRRALCVPRLLAALRRNRVPVVRAGAVPALVDAIASAAAPPEAREHAAGALFGLALHEGNHAAIGVLGAVPPLLAGRDHAPRARRDAGMALYHLSLAAVNQSKLARAPGASMSLLSVASVATASGILSDDGSRNSELQEWCVAALYAMSRGSPRFRGLARAAGADRPLMLIAEQASPGVHKEMAQTALRTMLGLADNSDDDQISNSRNNEGNHGGGKQPQRRRVASWSAPPAATPTSSHQWRSVYID
ncbi:U-box domain-containing protein 39-like [Panicum miliaceum]|uniref:RING-type E3 ubiquitin transferase n=1 Tax=Panicum miliaceum TaxID=4540 RepID=A0A3L6PKW1_PANMI|nr:U-box domain-containing protein 39-like [Panicum miliaceum]